MLCYIILIGLNGGVIAGIVIAVIIPVVVAVIVIVGIIWWKKQSGEILFTTFIRNLVVMYLPYFSSYYK